MEKLRKLSNNTFAKVLLALIALSFIFVGTGGSFNDNAIATVNDTEINKATVYNIYKNVTSQPNFRDLSSSEIRKTNIVEDILVEQIGLISKYTKANELGIGVSDKFIIKKITSIKAFQSLGRFDKIKFQQILSANNLTPKQFINDLKQEEISNRYFLSFDKIKFNANNIKNLLKRNESQQRNIVKAEIAINSIAVGDITDKKLEAFYKNKKFAVNETRDVKVLEISTQNVANSITDKQAKDFFTANKNTYESPELRDYYVIPGENKKLLKIKQLVKNGTDIKTAVKKVLDLNYATLINKNKDMQSTDKIIREVVFNSKLNDISEPIDMILNNVIVVVSKISAKKSKTFKALKSQIKTDIAKTKILDLVTTAEDEISEEKSIDEIAKAIGIKTYLANKMPKAKDARFPISANQKVIKTIFKSPLNEVSFPIEIAEDKFVILSVNKINPKYTPEFKTVKEYIKNTYIQDQRNIKIEKITNSIRKAKSENEFRKIAKNLGLNVSNKNNLKKQGKTPPAIFSTPKGKINLYQKDGKFVAFYIRDIKIPKTINDSDNSPLVNSFNKLSKEQNISAVFDNIRNSQDIEINDLIVNDIYLGR